MRFQTTETVPTSDTEGVLHALEVSLREFSGELQREGHRITLYGLGPSPRTRNYRDTAVFDVVAANGSTTIRADVTFQASALLGVSGQEEVVRSKLDYAFDQVRMQLGMPEAGGPAAREPHPQWVPEAEGVADESCPEEFPAMEQGEGEGMQSFLPPAAIEEEAQPHAEKAPEELKPARSEAQRPETPFGVWAASLRSVQVPPKPGGDSDVGQSAEAEERDSEVPRLRLGAEAHKTNLPVVLAILLGAAVAAGSVYGYWSRVLGRANPGVARPKAAVPAPEPQPAPQPVVTIPAPPPPPRHEEANPKVWLEQWADAMRGRDAELQASFYADPVAHYLDDANVSREALTTFFRSQIQARNDLWTMRLERVSIEPLTGSHVIARLTKHFMELEESADGSAGNQISDRYVRSRLELRRENGEWKIVSEQDIKPAAAE